MPLFVIFLNVSWTILDNSTSDKNICLRRYFRLLKVNCDGTIELQSKVRVVSFYLLLQCYSEGTSKIDVQPFLAFFLSLMFHFIDLPNVSMKFLKQFVKIKSTNSFVNQHNVRLTKNWTWCVSKNVCNKIFILNIWTNIFKRK